MVSMQKDGLWEPKIKMSDNPSKITNPCAKQVYRFYDKHSDMALADLICKEEEDMPRGEKMEIFHPIHTWKRKSISNFKVKSLLETVMKNGELVMELPKLAEIRQNAMRNLASLWDSHKRFENPQTYIVDLSKELWETKNELLHKHGG